VQVVGVSVVNSEILSSIFIHNKGNNLVVEEN